MSFCQEDCVRWSRALRQGIIAYDFLPREVLLLLILCEETFDRGAVQGKTDLVGWSRRLSMRPDKLRREVWSELLKTGVIDFNEGQGTFQLRPAMRDWSRTRSLRVPVNDVGAGQELPLTAERPLSESLSELSRESVLVQGTEAANGASALAPAGSPPPIKDWAAEFRRLAAAVAAGRVEEEFGDVLAAEKSAAPSEQGPAEKSAVSVAEKSAATQASENGGLGRGEGGAAEKSAVPIASYSSDRNKAKLAMAAEKSAAAWRWLESLDKRGHLREPRCANQWGGLCARDPGYVLEKLKGALARGQELAAVRGGEVGDPLAYMARKAREDRKFA